MNLLLESVRIKSQSPNLPPPDSNTIKSHLVVKRLKAFPRRTLCLFLFLPGRSRNSRYGIGIHDEYQAVLNGLIREFGCRVR